MQKNKYKIDFEGTYLMKSVLPDSYEKTDISQFESLIKSVAKKTFRNNASLLRQVGFDEEDVYSIFSLYTLAFVNNSENPTAPILHNFLKQRSIRYIETIKSKSNNITLESVRTIDENSLVDLDDPESILMAKELAEHIVGMANQILKYTAENFAVLIYRRNKQLLNQNDVQLNTIKNMAMNYAWDYAGRSVANNTTPDLSVFHRLMTFKFSKFLKSLRN